MQKQTKYHYSVTENGNIQVKIVTEYFKAGKLIDKRYGDPMTPANTNDMTGWDDRSKDIVVAITDPEVIADFTLEKINGTIAGDPWEEVRYDRVLEEDGKIAVRKITRIFDEGEEVSKKYHRSWIMPGDDPSGNDVISKALAMKLHTPEVVEAYKAKIAEPEKEETPGD